MESLFQLAASIGGISGLLALVILAMYRWDRKASEDRLTSGEHGGADGVNDATCEVEREVIR